MSSGLQRRRVPGGGGENSTTISPSSSRPELANQNSYSGRNSPAVNNRNEGINTIDQQDSDHRIAFDPRDMEEGQEREKFPKLTMMEEVLLLGLKDKQGYLSFWNDNISYTLRGCILLELAFRSRISMQKDSNRRRFELADRLIEVIDDRLTGEVLLDEALKMMKASEKMSVGSWIDLMSGETWNIMKIGYQLKQVRERLAKGLVDKGILRTEKRNFLLFDMATHPVADPTSKDEIRKRVISVLTARTPVLSANTFLPAETPFRVIRSVSMVCAAYAANVLENALSGLGHDTRERAFQKVDAMLGEYSNFPFRGSGEGIGAMVRDELEKNRDKELQLEIVAAVLQVFTRLDSIL